MLGLKQYKELSRVSYKEDSTDQNRENPSLSVSSCRPYQSGDDQVG